MSEKSYDSDFTYSSRSSKHDPGLKNQLLQLLKDKGMVDKLKTQVRHNLISEIAAKESIFNMKNKSSEKQVTDTNIFYHTSISVIFDFLNQEDFQYTKSVFTPETGVSVDKFYTFDEIIRILQLDIKSEFYNKLKNAMKHCDNNFLTCLLKIVSEFHSCKRNEIEVQTEKIEKYIPLSEKMEKLDNQFEDRQKQGILKTQQLYEDRIIAFQRDIEKRLRQEMENEIQRFKDHEISSIKIKEENLFDKLFKDKTKQLEEEYQSRLSALKDRERISQENVLKLKESHERENYLERQHLLRDINNIQEREIQNKKERERIDRELEMMKEQHKTRLDQIEQRNSRLKELEIGIDLRINQEVNSIKLNEEKRMLHKWKEVEILEMKLMEEKRYLDNEKCNIEKMKEQLTKRQCLFNEMEIINYPVLKQQNNSLQDQMEELKQQLEHQSTINQQDKHKIACLLKQKMSPNFEQSVLTNELERARDIFKRERGVLEEQKELLEKRLLEEIKNKRTISDQYSQQQEMIEILSRQISDNKDYSFKNKMGYMSSRSQNNALYSARYTNRDLSPHSTNDQRRKLSNFDPNINDCVQEMDECSLPIDIEDVTNDAKHKLLSLDEETEQINKAYHEFKNRLANSSSAIGEIRFPSNPELHSKSFHKGLEEGRKLKDRLAHNEFVVPSFNELKFDDKKLLFSSDLENIETSPNYIGEFNRPNFSGNNSSQRDSLKIIEGELTKISDNNNKLFTNIHSSTDDLKSIPMSKVNTDENFDEEKSIFSNIEAESDKTDFINLNNNWGKSNTISKKNSSSIEKEIDIIENKPIVLQKRNDEDGDDIDPVLKKYMEIVKKQKETDTSNIANKSTDIPKNIPNNKSENEEISEFIKTDTENSSDLVSNKKESPNQSESESFW